MGDLGAGYVTEFDVDAEYLARYPSQVVGDSRTHVEYWVPDEELDEFNSRIVGEIRVIRAFRGDPPVEIEV